MHFRRPQNLEKTITNVFFLVPAITAVVFLMVSGCGSVQAPNAITNQDGTDNADTTTQQVNEVIDAVVAAAQAVGRSVAAILPTKDLQTIFENGQAPPTCPSMGTEFNASEILLSLDYGNGCIPTPYSSTFGGVVEGTSFIAFNAFDFALVDLSVDNEPMDGTIAGSFIPTDTGTTFIVSVNVVLNDRANVRGTATVEVEDSTGVFRFVDDGLISTTVSEQAISITLSGLTVDATTHGNFVPEAGSAMFNMPSANDGTAGETITIDFTAQSPVDGSVLQTSMP